MQKDNNNAADQVDAVIIGAGFGGLYALHQLRDMGLECRAFEAASGVGGTWYWNRYPGARTDSAAYVYQYWFSEELLNEWRWSERFPGQAEVERYLNFVAERFDLFRHITLDTRVTKAHWSESESQWTVTTDTGEVVRCRYLISCVGLLSEPLYPDIPGLKAFSGELIHTGRWPKEGVALEGKRVGVIGTGATGIQVVQSIASRVKDLYVFQRHAEYGIPMNNYEFSDEEWSDIKADYPKTREQVQQTFIGMDFDLVEQAWDDFSDEGRLQKLEEIWSHGSLRFWGGNFVEIFFEDDKNKVVTDFVKARIRSQIDDPEVADKLMPEHGFGGRRVPMENGYFKAFNRSNVHLVDVKADPIESIEENQVKTQSNAYELDVLITATGFNASRGSMNRIDIQGRDGLKLSEHWSHEVSTALGMQIHGFPNLFATTAPLAPSAAFCNIPSCLQQQVDWIRDCLDYAHKHGKSVIEPTAEFEAQWVAHHDEASDGTIMSQQNSWWNGANIDGKRGRLISYPGGVGAYRAHCDEVVAKNYEGFEMTSAD